MIRYRYSRQLDPPGPFVNVTVRCPATGAVLANLPAQVDSAADRTILPSSVVARIVLDGPQLAMEIDES